MSADAAAGHSFGEVTALAVAGVLAAERLVETARIRGTLMTEAGSGKDGAMLAVAVGVEDALALLDTHPALGRITGHRERQCATASGAGRAAPRHRAGRNRGEIGWLDVVSATGGVGVPLTDGGRKLRTFEAYLKTLKHRASRTSRFMRMPLRNRTAMRWRVNSPIS